MNWMRVNMSRPNRDTMVGLVMGPDWVVERAGRGCTFSKDDFHSLAVLLNQALLLGEQVVAVARSAFQFGLVRQL